MLNEGLIPWRKIVKIICNPDFRIVIQQAWVNVEVIYNKWEIGMKYFDRLTKQMQTQLHKYLSIIATWQCRKYSLMVNI